MALSFKNMMLKKKLLIAFLSVALLSVIPLVISFITLTNMRETLEKSAEESQELSYYEELKFLIAQQQISEKNYLITGQESYLENDEEIDTAIDNVFNTIINVLDSQEEVDAVKTIKVKIEKYENIFKKILQLKKENNTEKAIEIMQKEHAPAIKEVDDALNEMIEDTQEDTKEAYINAGEHSESAVKWFALTVASSVISIIMAVCLSLLLAKSITRPLLRLRDVAEKVSMGDMNTSFSIKQNDEIGQLAKSFERMLTAIRFFASEVNKPR